MEVMTRQSIKDWEQKQISMLFEKHGIGFAFSEQQLKEYIEKQKSLGYEGKFVRMGISGMFCRLDTADAFMSDYKKLNAETKQKMKKAVTMDEYIEYELSNYECYYTGNYLDENMMNEVRAYFPQAKPKDFKRVYEKTKNNHE